MLENLTTHSSSPCYIKHDWHSTFPYNAATQNIAVLCYLCCMIILAYQSAVHLPLAMQHTMTHCTTFAVSNIWVMLSLDLYLVVLSSKAFIEGFSFLFREWTLVCQQCICVALVQQQLWLLCSRLLLTEASDHPVTAQYKAISSQTSYNVRRYCWQLYTESHTIGRSHATVSLP